LLGTVLAARIWRDFHLQIASDYWGKSEAIHPALLARERSGTAPDISVRLLLSSPTTSPLPRTATHQPRRLLDYRPPAPEAILVSRFTSPGVEP